MQNIDGLPPGTRLVRIGVPKAGEYYMYSTANVIRKSPGEGPGCPYLYPIIAADNPYNVVDLETVPIPDGFECGSEPWYRAPLQGEHFICANPGPTANPGEPFQAKRHYGCGQPRIIIRPITVDVPVTTVTFRGVPKEFRIISIGPYSHTTTDHQIMGDIIRSVIKEPVNG